jgi:hypothetical protein
MQDIINNVQHPKIVDALLVAPAFTSKLPDGVKLSLKPNVQVIGRAGIDQSVLEGETYSWAILSEPAGEVASAAMVNTSLTDGDMDALDEATASGKFMSYVKNGAMHYKIADGPEIGPDAAHYEAYNFALEGGALANASGGALIVSNGPRWLVVSADGGLKGLKFSRTYGQREDRSPVAEGVPTTSMYGALVGNAFEHVITRAEHARLLAEQKETEAAKST